MGSQWTTTVMECERWLGQGWYISIVRQLCCAVSGNTSNMLMQIKWHHPVAPITGARQKKTGVQQLIPAVFKKPLNVKADRAKDNTKAIGIFRQL